MKWITDIRSEEELELFYRDGFREFILRPYELCTRGNLSWQKIDDLLRHKKKKQDLSFFIQVDKIIREDEFSKIVQKLFSLPLSSVDAFRIKDLGLASYFAEISENRPVKFHLLLENGNNNLQSLLSYEKIFHGICSRLVFSLEIPFFVWKEWLEMLKTETEVLLFGPVRLFYSIRPLLRSHIGHANLPLKAKVYSEEFKTPCVLNVIEDMHGTYIYHQHVYSSLKNLDEIMKTGLSAGRVDRFNEISFEDWLKHKELSLPEKEFTGFFEKNETDIHFEKLKNKHREQRDRSFAAVVLTSIEKESLVLWCRQLLKPGRNYYFITPTGKHVSFFLDELKDIRGGVKNEIMSDHLALIPYVREVTTLSYLYFC